MNHLKQLAAALPGSGADALLILSAPGEWYAVGFAGEGTVLVTAGESYYFTDPRYIEDAEKKVTGCTISVTSRENPASAQVKALVEKLGLARVGMEDGALSVANWRMWKENLPCEVLGAQQLVNALRQSKDEEELSLMVRAQEITDEALTAVLPAIKPGVTEQEIAAKLVYEMLRRGARKVSFDPIVVSGAKGSMPHGIPGDKKICSGEFVTMDFGCMWGGYCSDMTRTVAVGEPTDEMRLVYNTVLEAQKAGIAAARAGVKGCDIDAAARRVIEKAGYGAYFGHSFGHSLGLEIHEMPCAAPSNAEPMPAGAVCSAEPGIYLPGRFGVRIEDVVILSPEGCRDITHSPRELLVL